MNEALPIFLQLIENKKLNRHKFKNFGEFYKTKLYGFAWQFSDNNGMISAILRQYIATQLKSMKEYQGFNYDTLQDIVRPLVAENLELFKYTLKSHWFKEYCDIMHRNS